MKEYKIETIQDFLKVPEDRIDDCLVEFKEFLEMLRAMYTVAEISAKTLGLDCSNEDLLRFCAFEWVDDGKRDVEINIEATE